MSETLMNIDRRWLLLLTVAASTAIGAAIASRSRRRNHRAVHALQQKTDLKTWENEGGNLAPAVANGQLP
jgi:hypothetical protein